MVFSLYGAIGTISTRKNLRLAGATSKMAARTHRVPTDGKNGSERRSQASSAPPADSLRNKRRGSVAGDPRKWSETKEREDSNNTANHLLFAITHVLWFTSLGKVVSLL